MLSPVVFTYVASWLCPDAAAPACAAVTLWGLSVLEAWALTAVVTSESLAIVDAILASPVKDSYERDAENNMTSYKNGDRFMYIEPMEKPIKRKLSVGNYTATIIHHGKDNRSCQACNLTGHKVGDKICPAYPKQPIYAFKSYQNPMSNHFPCDLDVFDENIPFKSWEHAFFWRMAIDLGEPLLAANIKNSKHAGVAKSLSKRMNEEQRHNWEDDNLDIIENLLYEKFKQCEPFRECLINNKEKIFAEATTDKKWATGLSPYISQYTDPEYWPGKNLLGQLLTNMAKNVDDLLDKIKKDHIPGSTTPTPYNFHTPEMEAALATMEKAEMDDEDDDDEWDAPHVQPNDSSSQSEITCEDKVEIDIEVNTAIIENKDQDNNNTSNLSESTSINDNEKSLIEATVNSVNQPRGRSAIRRIADIKRSRSASLKILKLRNQLPDIPLDKKEGSGVFLEFLEKAHNIIEEENRYQKRKEPDSSPDGPTQDKKQLKGD